MRGSGNDLNTNVRDATDTIGDKFRRACEIVETEYDDRRPARGKTGSRSGDYRPLDDVSREGRQVEYRKWPRAKG